MAAQLKTMEEAMNLLQENSNTHAAPGEANAQCGTCDTLRDDASKLTSELEASQARVEQLQQAVQMHGAQMQSAQMQITMLEAEANSFKQSAAEVAPSMPHGSASLSNDVSNNEPNTESSQGQPQTGLILQPVTGPVALVFNSIDLDSNGEISKTEFKEAFEGQQKDMMNTLMIDVGVNWQDLFSVIDRDESGTIDLQELQRHVDGAKAFANTFISDPEQQTETGTEDRVKELEAEVEEMKAQISDLCSRLGAKQVGAGGVSMSIGELADVQLDSAAQRGLHAIGTVEARWTKFSLLSSPDLAAREPFACSSRHSRICWNIKYSQLSGLHYAAEYFETRRVSCVVQGN